MPSSALSPEPGDPPRPRKWKSPLSILLWKPSADGYELEKSEPTSTTTATTTSPMFHSPTSGPSSSSTSPVADARATPPSGSGPQAVIVTCCAMNGDCFVIGHSTGEVILYSARTGEYLRSLRGHQAGVWAIALVTRGGRPWTGVSSEHERDYRSLDQASLVYLGTRSDPSGASQGWGQRSSLVVSGGSDRTVAVWDIMTGKCTHAMAGHTGTIRCVKTLHNRPIAISGSRDATLRVWDLNKGRLIRVLVGHQQGITCLEVCGNRAVSGSYDALCKVWNVDTGECIQTLAGHLSRIYCISFDGYKIASGSYDGTTRVWDATTGQCMQSISSSRAAVVFVQISPSSRMLATASSDGRVVVYWLPTFQIAQAFVPHQSAITAFQFEDESSSAEHHVLLTAGNDGCVRRFDIDSGRFLRDFCGSSEAVWKVITKNDVCGVVCQRNGRMVVEVWSTRTS